MAKRKGRRGRKRNSARILALETSKKAKKESIINNKRSPSIDTQQQHNETPSPPPPAEGAEDSGGRPSKGRKKKRLDKVAVSSIGLTTQQFSHLHNECLKKRMLEFILDILQRRETHEIFAQPVDAEENDVFLITNNAMLFNSSATIYFRQARAIHELAKRVFHTLKTDPEKIELEFSLTRRRYGRKRQVESVGDLPFKVGAKLRRTSLACRESFGAKLSDNEILHGCSDGRDVNFCKTERRQTYNPQTSIVSEESIVSTVDSSLQQLVPIPSHSVLDASLPIYPPPAPQPPSCMDSVINGVTVDILGSHGTASNGKNILTSDSFNIDSGACRGKTALGIGRLDILGDASKGKSVFTVPHCDIMGTHSALQGEKDCCTIKANDRAVYRDMNSTLMHGLGKESDAPTDLSCRASSGLVSQPLEWGRPSPWGPKAIGEVDQYLPEKPSNLSPLSQDAFQWQQMQSRQVQPGGEPFGPRRIHAAQSAESLGPGRVHAARTSVSSGHLSERDQPNSNAPFWNFEQQFFRGTQHPDLALRDIKKCITLGDPELDPSAPLGDSGVRPFRAEGLAGHSIHVTVSYGFTHWWWHELILLILSACPSIFTLNQQMCGLKEI
ncbi:hypothetical protein Acr_28g0007200 [Actinidia rufa]|uniref:DNA-binding bromodomain-containing protein n=1 Tax=Actinidia rufa TaxID=165716 RepID=A0A7J0HAL5_9ERIC|nr:hypothetical protein Acr_28g0007200 [Actinidia rufa]